MVSVPELDALTDGYKPRYRDWTPDEEEILRTYYNRVPIEALVKHLDRTKNSIYTKASVLGLTRHES